MIFLINPIFIVNYFEQIYTLAKALKETELLQLLQTSQCCIDECKKGSALSAAGLLAQENNKPAVALLQKLGANINLIARGAAEGIRNGLKHYVRTERRERVLFKVRRLAGIGIGLKR